MLPLSFPLGAVPRPYPHKRIPMDTVHLLRCHHRLREQQDPHSCLIAVRKIMALGVHQPYHHTPLLRHPYPIPLRHNIQ